MPEEGDIKECSVEEKSIDVGVRIAVAISTDNNIRIDRPGKTAAETGRLSASTLRGRLPTHGNCPAR